MFTRLFSFIRAIFRRRRFEAGMADELRFHLDAYAADLQRAGLSADEARRRARVVLGSVDGVKEECRQARGLRWIDQAWQDLRYTLRLTKRAPGFTVAAVASLGLGIGGTTAIFTLVEAVSLRSLPVRDPEQLYILAHGEDGSINLNSNYPLFERIRDAGVFSGVTAFRTGSMKVSLGEGSELVRGQFVSGNYHAVVGAPLLLGRGFVSEPDHPTDQSDIAIISERYWVRRFGRAPDVIGRTITTQGRAVTIVGVTAAAFTGLVPGSPVDVTLPLSMYVRNNPDYLRNHASFTGMPILARVRDGESEGQALAAVDVVFQRFMSEPENRWARRQNPAQYAMARLQPAARGMSGLRMQYGSSLYVLLGMAALVLLIASANVANLLLSRSTARAREVAVRLCIGGERQRIVRQFLTESVVLAIAGGIVGVLLAVWATGSIVALFSSWREPIVLDVALNLPVLAFTAAASMTTGLLFGIAPALKATRIDFTPMLKADRAAIGLASKSPLTSRVLIAGQVALCLMIVVVAALLTQSVRNLMTRPAGFDPANVLLFDVDIYGVPQTQSELRALYIGVLERLHRLPGVVSASVSTMTPIHTSGDFRGLALAGLPETPEDRGVWANRVTPEYFQTIGVRMLRGRTFNEAELSAARPVAIINERAARHIFGEADPIGRTITWMSRSTTPMEVVGVVEDTHRESLRQNPPRMVYTPLTASELPGRAQVAVRTMGDPIELAGTVRALVRGVNERVAVDSVRTMSEQVGASLVRERALTWLSTAFAALALVLACVGLYGVMSYTMARRVREIGIRIALGASRAMVLRRVLRDAFILALAGVVIGSAGAFFITNVVSTFLFGVSARDPLTLVAAGIILIATMMMAAYIPARRAAHVDPVQALRAE
jgi:predicted permease